MAKNFLIFHKTADKMLTSLAFVAVVVVVVVVVVNSLNVNSLLNGRLTQGEERTRGFYL